MAHEENPVKLAMEGQLPYYDEADVRRPYDKPIFLATTSAVATTTALAETIAYVARRPCRLRSAGYVGDTAATADNTSFATFNIFKRTVTTPGTAVTMLTAPTQTTASSGTGNIVAYTAKDLSSFKTSTVADSELETGDVVTMSVTKTAGGVALGTGRLYADLEEDGGS